MSCRFCAPLRDENMPQNRGAVCLQLFFFSTCVCLYIAVINGVILFTDIMQINATCPWLIQPSQLELMGIPAGCLISGWLYILRARLGISGFFHPPLLLLIDLNVLQHRRKSSLAGAVWENGQRSGFSPTQEDVNQELC